MKNDRIRVWLVLGLAVRLGACEHPRVERSELAKSALVGLSKDRLLSCAGAPSRVQTEGGREVLTFVKREVVERRSPFRVLRRFGGLHEGGDDREIRIDECTARIVLRDGAVESLSYDGPWESLQKMTQCDRIVRGCLAAHGP